MEYVFWSFIGYFSGSVLYGYWLPKLFKGIDVCKVSTDGNPGTYNAIKYAGKPIGYLVALCEALKGLIPVHIAYRLLDPTNILFSLVMLAPALGHGFSMFAHFVGGKCLGISYGIFLGLLPEYWQPLLFLCILYQTLSHIFVITPHFCRSITIYSLVALLCIAIPIDIGVKAGTALVCGLVIKKHIHSMEGLKYNVDILPGLRKAGD